MITPFDRLIYESARLQDVYGVYKHFLELLQEVKITAVDFPQWNPRTGQALSACAPNLWELGPALCIFTQRGIVPGYHRPAIIESTEGRDTDLPIHIPSWVLDAILVFQRTAESFDVIPMMSQTSGQQTPFPEMQIRYDLHNDDWAWKYSPSGFVNAFSYYPQMEDAFACDKKCVLQRLNWLGQYVLNYLGAYDILLGQPGEWQVIKPKPPRYKEKKGKVKKIHSIAQAGFKRFIPDA